MSWEVTALVAVVLAAIIVAYRTWAHIDLARAQDKRAGLRLELEDGVVKTFAKAIEELQEKQKSTQAQVNSAVLNARR